jgi:hypothetical protein
VLILKRFKPNSKFMNIQGKCKHNKNESPGVWIMLKILIFNLWNIRRGAYYIFWSICFLFLSSITCNVSMFQTWYTLIMFKSPFAGSKQLWTKKHFMWFWCLHVKNIKNHGFLFFVCVWKFVYLHINELVLDLKNAKSLPPL